MKSGDREREREREGERGRAGEREKKSAKAHHIPKPHFPTHPAAHTFQPEDIMSAKWQQSHYAPCPPMPASKKSWEMPITRVTLYNEHPKVRTA